MKVRGIELEAKVSFWEGWDAVAAYTYLDYEIKVPDYVVVDAALSYDFGVKNPDFEGLGLRVNGRNLFDNDYIASCWRLHPKLRALTG